MKSILQIANEYCHQGWSPIPIPYMEKAPVMKDWQHLRITKENNGNYFGNEPCNIGVLLGKASKGLIDVDLDCPEAMQLAPDFLPPTRAFGRNSKPKSHYLYYSSLDEIIKFETPDGGTLVEIRGSGQTVFPGSKYKGDREGKHRGEAIRWDNQNDVTKIDPDELKRSVGRLAAASLLLRIWNPGIRDELATALAGTLLRSGWEPDEVDHLIRTVAQKAGDEELRKRFKAKSLASKLKKDGGRVPGMKKLEEVIGRNVLMKIRPWLGLENKGAFFKGDTFIPAALVDYIIEGNDLFHDGSGFYRYDNDAGYWRQIHEDEIGKPMKKALGMKARSARISDAMKLLEIEVFKAAEKIEENPELVNLSNGMLIIRTRELLPHDKKYYSRVQIPIEYDPSAKAERWDRFLDEIFPDDPGKKITLQDFSGYCLLPKIFIHKCLFLIGAGANGKSVFLNTLCKVIGEKNISALELHHLSDKFMLGNLEDKLLNASSEVESGTKIESNIFKQVISGDLVQADMKFKSPFTFRPIAKHIFSMNEVPIITDKTYALRRRLIVIRFNQFFDEQKADKSLEDKLSQELPGILNWCLEGLSRVRESEEIPESKQMEEDKKEFLKYLNPVQYFVEEECNFGEGLSVEKSWLYGRYADWCKGSGVKALSKIKFYRQLLEDYPTITIDTFGVNKFKGIDTKSGSF